MLVLSRKVGQSLVIADNVTATVTEIGLDYVRLTIDAPNERDIRRRYRDAMDVPENSVEQSDRPIVVTLSLHHGAILDRLRRGMTDDETTPSRDEALGLILETVADTDDFPIRRKSHHQPAPPQPPRKPKDPAGSATYRNGKGR